MPCRHMRDFMRNGSGQLSLGLSHPNQPGIHKYVAAWQGERVYRIGVDDFEVDWNLGVGIASQVLSQAVDVLACNRVIHHLGLLLDLDSKLFTQRHLLFDGIEVNTFADIAIPDFIRIFLFVGGVTEEDKQRQQRDEREPAEHRNLLDQASIRTAWQFGYTS